MRVSFNDLFSYGFEGSYRYLYCYIEDFSLFHLVTVGDYSGFSWRSNILCPYYLLDSADVLCSNYLGRFNISHVIHHHLQLYVNYGDLWVPIYDERNHGSSLLLHRYPLSGSYLHDLLLRYGSLSFDYYYYSVCLSVSDFSLDGFIYLRYVLWSEDLSSYYVLDERLGYLRDVLFIPVYSVLNLN